jgi:carboxylesterase
MTVLKLMPKGEPFLFMGGSTGCLLIHGFTGTLYEMRGLGERLAAAGYTVLGVRLAHHGAEAADMNRSRWHDWYLSALDGWHLLNDCCQRVIPIGLSMGGLTALLLAAREAVAGVVTMSVPVTALGDRRQGAARFVWPVKPFIGKPAEETAAPIVPCYDVYPVRAVGQLTGYLAQVDQALPAITAPALLIHARGDQSAPPENLDYIYGRIGSVQKERLWLERGGHVVTEDLDKEVVYERVCSFVGQIGSGVTQSTSDDRA